MSAPSIPDWPRPHFSQPAGPAFLFYVIYGVPPIQPKVSASRYRCAGLSRELDVMSYGPGTHPEVLGSFREGYAWEQLKLESPEFAATIGEQANCWVIRGQLQDGPTLNSFRDVIGFITYLLDEGGICIYDPFIMKWWRPEEWREQVFDVAGPSPHAHVVILCSEQGDGAQWFHTRGMRKFGRPDLSMHDVTTEHEGAVIELFNRFIELHALGGVIPEEQAVRMRGLPEGLQCFHGGDYDDPDFNNVHLEIK